MDEFSRLLEEFRRPIERYVRIRLHSQHDADDLLQEICLTAYRRFGDLRDKKAFLAWLMAIARSKMTDYYRAQARKMEIPMEISEEMLPCAGLRGRTQRAAVRETISGLADREKQILYLYYFKGLPQADIAQILREGDTFFLSDFRLLSNRE